MTPVNLAQSLPVKVRQAIYSVLATAIGLELVFDIVPDVWQGKVLAALAVLGFGVAVSNTSTKVDGS